MLRKIREKINSLPVYNFFLGLFFANLLFIGLAVIFYQDHFLFWEYPFSFAGEIKTQGGEANAFSSFLYSSAMVVSGILMLALAWRFFVKKNGTQDVLRTIVAFVCGSGFLIAGFSPNDIAHNFHVLGSSLFVASLWIFASEAVFVLKNQIPFWKFILIFLILQVPIFAYAGTYFAEIEPLASILQKFALAGLTFALCYATNFQKKFKS